MRDHDEAGDKILWLAFIVPGTTVAASGVLLAVTGSANWLDQGLAWAIFTAEEIIYNVNVSDYIRARGP